MCCSGAGDKGKEASVPVDLGNVPKGVAGLEAAGASSAPQTVAGGFYQQRSRNCGKWRKSEIGSVHICTLPRFGKKKLTFFGMLCHDATLMAAAPGTDTRDRGGGKMATLHNEPAHVRCAGG